MVWLYDSLVQRETLIIYHEKVFASSLCVLTFSLVLGKFKQLYYPNNNMNKYKKMMVNQWNVPMTKLVSEKQIISFWSNTTGSLALNHFVSLISHKGIRENKKRKIFKKVNLRWFYVIEHPNWESRNKLCLCRTHFNWTCSQ